MRITRALGAAAGALLLALSGLTGGAASASGSAEGDAAATWTYIYTADYKHKASWTPNYMNSGLYALAACNTGQPLWPRHATRARGFTDTGWYEIRTEPSDSCVVYERLQKPIFRLEVCGWHDGRWSDCRSTYL